mmetsp:Transcript_32646/g.81189  ORF Transcript_32646/g.81189 Transcript_32646/m.81189 type:complete len:157 (+) Transcript_32646:60-530(+)
MVGSGEQGASPSGSGSGSVRGRFDKASGKWQLHVDPLLSKLTGLFDSAANADLFCLVGITLADLYSSPSDLFVAGMAAGGSGVAIFSFARYHPHVALSETHWWDYGYTRDGHSFPRSFISWTRTPAQPDLCGNRSHSPRGSERFGPGERSGCLCTR